MIPVMAERTPVSDADGRPLPTSLSEEFGDQQRRAAFHKGFARDNIIRAWPPVTDTDGATLVNGNGPSTRPNEEWLLAIGCPVGETALDRAQFVSAWLFLRRNFGSHDIGWYSDETDGSFIVLNASNHLLAAYAAELECTVRSGKLLIESIYRDELRNACRECWCDLQISERLTLLQEAGIPDLSSGFAEDPPGGVLRQMAESYDL